jgi:non-ribosomal peptide synthetase component F
VSLDCSVSIVSDPQAASIAATFSRAVSQIRDNCYGHVGQLDLFSDYDRENIWERNKQAIAPTNCCVHDFIHDRSLNKLDTQAICAWDGNFTYGELDDLSSRLAGRLVTELDISPEVFVPLCFEKSKWTIVTMLAVMKAAVRAVRLCCWTRRPICEGSVRKSVLKSYYLHLKLASHGMRSIVSRE